MPLTIVVILLICAAVALALHAFWSRCPLWVSVLFLVLIEAVRVIPLK